MIINTKYSEVENSDNFSKNLFSIGDPAIIFDILRSKLYSDPLGAVCREITSNARDSHIEANKPSCPIEIILPNKISPSLIIKDFGVGISPDRAENIFVQYGKSTKRNDNTQTGGFGMGCKCPFAITDSFSIVTVFNGIKYSYSAVIDETKVGALLLLDKRATDESNGTSIIIPIKEKDFNVIDEKINEVTRFWSTQPIIKNSKLSNVKQKIDIAGSNWFILDPINYCNENNNYSFYTVKVLIDKIPYSVSFATLKEFIDSDSAIFLSKCKFLPYLEFNVGELSLSASREALYFDDSTKEKLKIAIKNFIKEVSAEISKKLKDKVDLFDAAVFFSSKIKCQYFHTTPKLDLTWNNFVVNEEFPINSANIISFAKNKAKKIRKQNKVIFTRLLLNEKIKPYIYINDLHFEAFKPCSLEKAFSNDDDIVYIINATSPEMEKEFNDKYNLDKYGFKKISSINPIAAKRSKCKSKNASPKPVNIYKYNNGNFNLSSRTAFKNSNKNLIFYLKPYQYYGRYSSNKRVYTHADAYKEVSYDYMKDFVSKFPDYNIWGVLSSELNDLEFLRKTNPNYEFVDKFLKKISLSISHEEYHDLCSIYNYYDHFSTLFSKQLNIKNKKSPFNLFKAQFNQKKEKLEKSNGNFIFDNNHVDLTSYNNWAKTNQTVESLVDNINKTYPMFQFFNDESFNNNFSFKIIEDYINTIDSQNI